MAIFSFDLVFVVTFVFAFPLRKTHYIFRDNWKADMWLIRTYWDFEFPRPVLPNFEFVEASTANLPNPA